MLVFLYLHISLEMLFFYEDSKLAVFSSSMNFLSVAKAAYLSFGIQPSTSFVHKNRIQYFSKYSQDLSSNSLRVELFRKVVTFQLDFLFIIIKIFAIMCHVDKQFLNLGFTYIFDTLLCYEIIHQFQINKYYCETQESSDKKSRFGKNRNQNDFRIFCLNIKIQNFDFRQLVPLIQA